MKNFLICTFCFVSVTLFSQEDLRWGVKAGVNLYGFNTTDGTDNDYTGLSIGAIAEYRVSHFFALQSGLEFNQKGGIFPVTVAPFATYSEAKLGYINVPVFAKLRIAKDFHAIAGPQLGFLVKDKYILEGNEVDDDATKKFDMELVGGLEYDFSNGIMLQAKYSYGTIEPFVNLPYKNSALNFSVGYFFK